MIVNDNSFAKYYILVYRGKYYNGYNIIYCIYFVYCSDACYAINSKICHW